jgi:hypothetical protein
VKRQLKSEGQKPTIKVNITTFHHPNAERMEILLTGANARLPAKTIAEITTVLREILKCFQ